MPLKESDIALMDKALRDELTSEEQKQFQLKLENPSFLDEWQRMQLMQTVIEEKGRTAIRAKLKTIEQELVSPQTGIKLNYTGWFLLLGIALLAVIAYFLWPASQQSPEELYIAYYQPYPNLIDPITKGGEETELSPFQLYETGNYQAAAGALLSQLQEADARWYFAQTMLAKQDFETARDIFQQFIREENSEYSIPAKWYLALVYLNQNKLDEVKLLLSQLEVSGHAVYAKKAKDILSQL